MGPNIKSYTWNVEICQISPFYYLLICLVALSLSCGTQDLRSSFCMWDFFSLVAFKLLVAARGIQFPDQGLKPGPPALAAQSLSHWTTREVPTFINKINTQLDLKRKNLTFLILPKWTTVLKIRVNAQMHSLWTKLSLETPKISSLTPGQY